MCHLLLTGNLSEGMYGMSFKSILTHLEPTIVGDEPHPLPRVLSIAQAFDAHLTALVFETEVLELAAAPQGPEAEQREAALMHRIEALAARHGVGCDVRGRSSFAHGVPEVLSDHARLSDLCIIGQPAAPGMAWRMMASGAIFNSGRPVLLLPEGLAGEALPRRILVAWDASPASVRAMHNALPLLIRADEIFVVSVTDDKEIRSGQSGIEAARMLARHGARATFQPIRRGHRSVLEALNAAGVDAAADLLVMGCIGHSPWHQMVFGSATQDLLRGQARSAVLATA